MASPSKRVVRFKLPTSSSSSEDDGQATSKFEIIARKMKRPMVEEEGNCQPISTEVKRPKNEIATTSEEEQRKKINSRCSPSKVFELMAEVKKNERMTEAVNLMGFNSMFQLPLIRFNTDLVMFLINNFDPNACCLYIRTEQIQISDIDVHLIFGLPLGNGSDVEIFGRNKTKIEEDYVNTWLQCFGGNIPNSEMLKETIFKDAEAGESFKRNFIVYLVSNLLAPMANSRQVNWRVLKSLKDTSIIKDFNWCNFLLVELCKRIREYKARDDENTRNVGGCILFLELFYLDRVHHGGQPTIKRSRSQARMIGWTNEIIRERIRKEMKEAKSFGFGKIAEDPLYRIIEAERQELLIKEERKEETKDEEESGNEDKQLNRFGELIDEVINASNAVQIANKNLFAKIKKIQKEFPSQTVSICDYLKIKAPSVVEKEEKDEEETSILFNTVDLMADVWMKAKQTFLREYKINVDVNKENEEAISKEKELHDVPKESRGEVQEDEVEKIPTFHLLSNSQDLVSPNVCHSDEIGKLFHECVEKQMEQEIIDNSDENIEALHVEEELRLTSNICRSLSLIDHPFLLRYSQYVSTAFLTDEEIKYVNFLFTRLPKNKTRFVNICGQIATSCQLQTLIGDEFVDRSVYFAWSALMNNIEGMCERKKIFLCPFQVESGVINIDSWIRNMKIQELGIYEMVIIPVIDSNVHYIIVFDIQKKLIFVNNMMNYAARSYDSILQKWKEALFSKLSEEGFEQAAQAVMSSRRVNTKGNIRLSLKGKSKCIDVEDCSIFAMRCMQYFDCPLMFESLGKREYLKLHRIKIAAELLLSEHNLLKKKFVTYAREEGCF